MPDYHWIEEGALTFSILRRKNMCQTVHLLTSKIISKIIKQYLSIIPKALQYLHLMKHAYETKKL